MSYAIVHFDVDDSVEAVPANWILNCGKKCYFPEAVNKYVRQKIKKGEPYDPEWTCFDCRIIRKYDNYRDARDNVSLALVTSDLSGSEKKRSKKNPSVGPSLPSHPLTNETEIIGLESISNVNQSEAAAFSSVPCLVLAEDSTPSTSKGAESQTNSVELVVVGGMEAFQQDVLAKLVQIQDVQNSHTEFFNAILNSLKPKESIDEDKYVFQVGMFPMKSIESVAELDGLTRDNDKAKNELVRCLTSCGGGTLDDAVKLMLKYLMTDDILTAHCCKGHGSKKKRFLDYDSLVQAMLCSLQRNARIPSHATMDNLEQAISKGLKQAMDRLTQQRKQEARLQSNITN